MVQMSTIHSGDCRRARVASSIARKIKGGIIAAPHGCAEGVSAAQAPRNVALQMVAIIHIIAAAFNRRCDEESPQKSRLAVPWSREGYAFG